MKVLVLGKGGREHALVWKLAQSRRMERVLSAPGNAGTAEDGVNVPLDDDDFDKLVRFAKKEEIGLTVVGSEEPLSRGVVDHFQKAGLRVFGPTKEAAQLESSKAFAKTLMRHADVPTGEFKVFDHPEPAPSILRLASIRSWSRPTASPPARASSSAPRGKTPSPPLIGSWCAKSSAAKPAERL